MAESLLYKALLRKLHIALILIVTSFASNIIAQSLLIPGDMTFVSVNSTNDTFEFVPLIPLEKGTTFFISSGQWQNDVSDTENGNIIKLVSNGTIESGTPILVGSDLANGFEVTGDIELSSKSEQLFIYQEDLENKRVIAGIGWGDKKGWIDRTFFGSGIPGIFKDYPNSFVRLGNDDNYQYFVRNGVSGTQKMLNQFVSNPAYWRGSSDKVFSHLGTSFKVLNAPVILFDEAVTAVNEDKKSAILNVAIYEHDGSKLTVDVVFDSLYSSVSRSELAGFRSQKINFTGLIGDAVYEVEIPLSDDDIFEGNETAIFNLENLSKGQAGDFISNTLFINDNEIPELKIEISEFSDESVLLLHNLERSYVNLTNWEIEKGDKSYIFPKGVGLEVGQTFILVSEDYPFAITENTIQLDDKQSELLSSFGTFNLNNEKSQKVAQYAWKEKPDNSSSFASGPDQLSTSNQDVSGTQSSQDVVNQNTSVSAVPGWKTISKKHLDETNFSDIDAYYWSEKEGRFLSNAENSSANENEILVAYFNSEAAQKLADFKKNKEIPNLAEKVQFSVSATDLNEDGLINANEGFSLLSNSTGKTILVQGLEKALKSELDLGSSVHFFKSNSDFSGLRKVEHSELVLPGSLLWVKFNEPLEEKNVELDVSELITNYQEEETAEFDSFINFVISGEGHENTARLNFVSDDENIKLSLDPSAVEELYLSEFKGIAFNYTLSENHYSEFTVDFSSPNTIILPVSLLSDKNGEYEITIKDWNNIPDDWVIKFEDQKEGTINTIDENWSYKLEYYGIVSDESDDIEFPLIEDRFKFHIVHKSQLEETEEEIPQDIELHQNYPNPFNPATSIGFYLPEENKVKLSVFNIVGQPIAVLFEGTKSSGEHIIEWDASDMPSGMYIYQLEVGTKIMTRKMTLVK